MSFTANGCSFLAAPLPIWYNGRAENVVPIDVSAILFLGRLWIDLWMNWG